MNKQRINLFFLVPSTQLGGCTSFTVHLYKALEVLGYDPVLYKIGKSGSKVTPFPYGLSAHVLTQEQAAVVARSAPSLIVYCFWAKCGDLAKPLIADGVPMVVHDPAEFHDDELAFMKERSYSPLVIRTANVAGLRAYGVEACYLPHPYVPTTLGKARKLYHAVCLARIDFRKRTHVIIDANKMLPRERAVHLYGEMNRIYEFHQLRKLHPDWRQWYHGEFPDQFGFATRMFAQTRFAVDLTHIKGDGGGTQYTFFEAWNAGIPLILNKAWATSPEDEVREGESCLMVGTADELVALLKRDPAEFESVIDGGRRIMEAHGPSVAQLYVEAMQR